MWKKREHFSKKNKSKQNNPWPRVLTFAVLQNMKFISQNQNCKMTAYEFVLFKESFKNYVNFSAFFDHLKLTSRMLCLHLLSQRVQRTYLQNGSDWEQTLLQIMFWKTFGTFWKCSNVWHCAYVEVYQQKWGTIFQKTNQNNPWPRVLTFAVLWNMKIICKNWNRKDKVEKSQKMV